jgi:hypothetical protein
MGEQKYFSGGRSLAILLSPAIVIFSSLQLGLWAAPNPQWKASLKFPVTDNIGQPNGGSSGGGTRAGGSSGRGTRGSCSVPNQMPLTSLMPIRNPENQRTRLPVNPTLTVAANPTFFLYVPTTTAQYAEFLVYDAQDNEVYQTILQIPKLPTSGVSTSGIVKLSLPANVSLETGKNYRWVFAISCMTSEGDMSSNRFVEGWVQRTDLSPDLKTKIDHATPLEQAKLYAEARIWSETLTIAAQLRTSKPDEWEELLKSVGLGAIAQAPFIEYHIPEQ